jgi:archaeosine synthase
MSDQSSAQSGGRQQLQSNFDTFRSIKTEQAELFQNPPIPSNQEEMELLTPEETLELLKNESSEVSQWLKYIKSQYKPPEHVDILLLAPCASEKPMPESRTYEAIAETLDRYPEQQKNRIHLVTVSEPMGLIPYEFQDCDTWLYDCPALFKWWCKENDKEWNDNAQDTALRILGEHIAGFLDRSQRESWYDQHIACVRHLTSHGNTSQDQTHRRMLERAQAISGASLDWYPTEETIKTLTENVGKMAWQMMGISHPHPQAELASVLDNALGIESNPNQQ